MQSARSGCAWSPQKSVTRQRHGFGHSALVQTRAYWEHNIMVDDGFLAMVSDAFIAGYRAARQHAAIVERSFRGRIVVSGRDRATYLQGLLTNDIAALTAG